MTAEPPDLRDDRSTVGSFLDLVGNRALFAEMSKPEAIVAYDGDGCKIFT